MKSLLLLAFILIDVGNPEYRAHLGYGWSRDEKSRDRTAAWIKRMEADVFFDAPATDRPLTLEIETRIFPVKDKRQNVGIYLNGHFIGEQICEDTIKFQTLAYTLPAEHVVAGKNRLIIRIGYLARPKGDGRKVGIFVDQIRIGPRGS